MPRDHFQHERPHVERLAQWLELPVAEYRDANVDGDESGADVLVVLQDGCRIGVQVTIIDPGGAIAAEKTMATMARDANGQPGVYATWAQNNLTKVVDAIARSVARKSKISVSPAQFDQLWLLMCSGVPEPGLLVSTFIMTSWLEIDTLNAADLSPQLLRSNYNRTFVLPIVGMEQALYCWSAGAKWEKITQQEPAWTQGPGVFDVRDKAEYSEWLTDTEGAFNREIEKCLREFQQKRSRDDG